MEVIVNDKAKHAEAEVVEEFNFCIARPWEEGGESLKVWAHGSQVHFGCLGYAKECRDTVRERTGEDYQVYKVTLVPEQ